MKRALLAVFLTLGLTGALGAQGAFGATGSGSPAAVSTNVLPSDVFFVSAQSAARALGLDRLLSLLHKLRPSGNDLGLGVIAGLIWAVVLRSLPALIGFLCGFTRQMLWVLFRWGKPPRNRRASSST